MPPGTTLKDDHCPVCSFQVRTGNDLIFLNSSPPSRSMQEYLDGLLAKPGSPIIHISDLDDVFVKSVLGHVKGSDPSDLAALASILDLLISYTDGRAYGSQAEQSSRILTGLCMTGLFETLTGSIMPGSEPVFSSLVSLIKFSRPAPDRIDELIDELVMPNPEVTSGVSLLVAVLDFESLFTKNGATLSERSIENLAKYIERVSMRSCSIVHLIWATYTGMLTGIDGKWYDKYHQRYPAQAQQSIEFDSFLGLEGLFNPSFKPKNHLNLEKDAFYLLMSFLSLFEVSKMPELHVLCHEISEILEGSPTFCELFWELELSTKPLIDHLLSLFPSSCHEVIPLLQALCQTESSAKRVYSLLERLENLTLMTGPDPSFVSTQEDGSLVARKNFDAGFEGVHVVIPEGATCKVDGKFYRWNIQCSGWDYLARRFSARRHTEAAKLFTRLYSVLPQAKKDTESYLERINALYLIPRGSSLYHRLMEPLSMKRIQPHLFEAIVNALASIDQREVGENEVQVLLLQSSEADRLVRELYVHESDLGSVGALLTLASAWLPSCENLSVSIVNNILSMASRFATRSELSLGMRLDCAIKLATLVEDLAEVPEDLSALSSEFTWKCIRAALKDDYFDASFLDLVTLDSVWDDHQDQLYSNMRDHLNRFLVKSMSSESFFLKFLKFLSKWSQRIPEAFPFVASSTPLLCSSLDSLSNRCSAAEFIFSLKAVNIKLLQSIVASREAFALHLIRDTVKDVHCGVLFVEYTWNLIKSAEFLGLSKVFPGSPKVLWDTLMAYFEEAIRTENLTSMPMCLELLANCLVLTSKDYDIGYLSLIISKVLNDFCKLALENDQLLHLFGRFVISCACSLPLREPLLCSLSAYMAKHEVSLHALTTIAEGLSLYKEHDKCFEQVLVLIFQKFEAASADGFNLFSDESVFDTWCNLLLLSTPSAVPKDAKVGLKVLVRLICSHAAMKPSEQVPKCLLLLARLFCHSELGSIALQFCSFYHLNDHIIQCLCENEQAQSLLPSFLLNEEFAAIFVFSGSLTLLLSRIGNKAIWDALFMLVRISDLHAHILHHLNAADIISRAHPGKLLDLLTVMAPAKIDSIDRPDLVCCSLIDMCWAILAERVEIQQAEAALNIISLILLQLSTGSLAEELYHLSRQNLPLLDVLNLSTKGQELNLSLQDLLQ